MRTFDVYKQPTQGYEAVKQGFSWPPWLFGVIWALVMRLCIHGLVPIGIGAAMAAINTAFYRKSAAVHG